MICDWLRRHGEEALLVSLALALIFFVLFTFGLDAHAEGAVFGVIGTDGRLAFAGPPEAVVVLADRLPRASCPACRRLGQKSEVYPVGVIATLPGSQAWYGTDGQLVLSRPGASMEFRCSKGHTWREAIP